MPDKTHTHPIQLNVRGPLLDAIRARAAAGRVPLTTAAREMLEEGLARPAPPLPARRWS